MREAIDALYSPPHWQFYSVEKSRTPGCEIKNLHTPLTASLLRQLRVKQQRRSQQNRKTVEETQCS
jgi:hypothetical protein